MKKRKAREKIRKLIEKGKKTADAYKFLGECMPKFLKCIRYDPLNKSNLK